MSLMMLLMMLLGNFKEVIILTDNLVFSFDHGINGVFHWLTNLNLLSIGGLNLIHIDGLSCGQKGQDR